MAIPNYWWYYGTGDSKPENKTYGHTEPTKKEKELNIFLIDKRNEQIKRAWSKNKQWRNTKQQYRVN